MLWKSFRAHQLFLSISAKHFLMKLQLALDRLDLAKELELVASVNRYIDFIEAGTPLLIREGIRVVREIRRRWRADSGTRLCGRCSGGDRPGMC
jgi:orotidine-5'-phosphate decarboxylase